MTWLPITTSTQALFAQPLHWSASWPYSQASGQNIQAIVLLSHSRWVDTTWYTSSSQSFCILHKAAPEMWVALTPNEQQRPMSCAFWCLKALKKCDLWLTHVKRKHCPVKKIMHLDSKYWYTAPDIWKQATNHQSGRPPCLLQLQQNATTRWRGFPAILPWPIFEHVLLWLLLWFSFHLDCHGCFTEVSVFFI